MKGGSNGGDNNSRQGESHIDHLWARMAARQQERTLSQGGAAADPTPSDLSDFLEHAIAISNNTLTTPSQAPPKQQSVAQQEASTSGGGATANDEDAATF
jgi:hypothetical protein